MREKTSLHTINPLNECVCTQSKRVNLDETLRCIKFFLCRSLSERLSTIVKSHKPFFLYQMNTFSSLFFSRHTNESNLFFIFSHFR